MFVQLIFEDGSSVCKNIPPEELIQLEVWDGRELIDFFENKFLNGVEEIEDWVFVDSGDPGEGSDVYQFDVRNYKNHHFVGKEIDGKIVASYNFLPEDSYEYNLIALGEDNPSLYAQFVWLGILEEDYDNGDDGYGEGDPYDDDGPYID